MSTELANKITEFFTFDLFLMISSGIFLVVITLLLKSIAESLTAYILFYADKHVSVGTPIKVYGEIGYVKGFNLFWVCIKTKEGFLRIPITDWKKSRFMILRSYKVEDL